MAGNVYVQVNFNLGTLVQQIALGSIGLPDIQRPFVWPNVKVRDLFDSMYRGYPVGYLLFWQNGQSSSPRGIGTDTKQVTPNLVIVDGQQRLTSLFAVFKGVPVVRSNFQPERIRIAFDPLKGRFEVTSAAIERDKAYIPDISVLWSDDADLFRIVNSYLEGLRSVREVTGEEVQEVQAAMVRLQQLSSFPFTALQLDPDISEEAVAEVFVRINSQGKTLNQADFILTLMSVFWDEGRTDLETFSRLSMSPSTNGPSPFNYFIQPSPDQLLRVGVGLGFKRGRLQYVYSILRGKDLESGEFSADRRAEQFDKLKEAQARVLSVQYWHDFMLCLRWAGYRSGRMISSQNALLYTYIFYLIGRTEFSITERDLRPVISQWFFMSALTGRYTNSPESAVESDLAMLRDVTTAQEFLARLRNACAVSLTNDFWEVTLPNDLATSAARSPSLFAYEASLILLEAPALFSHFKVEQMLDPALQAPRNALERHHLFPRGYLATLGITETRDTNQIANYAYIEWKDNANIADKAPVAYVPEKQEGFNQSQLAKMYRLHALPVGWEHMDYQKFLGARREVMASIIREGYEKLTQGAPMEVPTLDLAEVIGTGESDSVEFKSTLRVNLHTHERDSRMEHAILRTLAGFLNTNGGTLVVGVADDGTPVGLDVDGFENEDKMALHLANIVNSRMGPNSWITMHANFEDYEEERVLVVHCEKARSAVYVSDGAAQHFYIRTGPSTTALNLSQTEEYIRQKFH